MGLWALSGVSLAALIVAGYPLAGVAAFIACTIATIAVFRRYNGPLFDERDRRLQEAASRRTLSVMGIGAMIVFPTTTALWALGIISWPMWLTPIAFFVAFLTFLHVGSLMYETSRTV